MVVMGGHVQWSHPVLVPSHDICLVSDELPYSVVMATSSSVMQGGEPLAVLGVHLTTWEGGGRKGGREGRRGGEGQKGGWGTREGERKEEVGVRERERRVRIGNKER